MRVNVITEVGSNWEGNIDLAKLHIKKSKECGATFVKFQMWRANDLYEKSHPYWNEIIKSELTNDIAKELKRYADEIGIQWFCSVFYPEAVDLLESINVPLYKIASRTARMEDKFSFETIKKVAATNKPTFISTGEGADKEKISKLFNKDLCKFTYCISKYPASYNDIDWNDLMDYDFFSDHTIGITAAFDFYIKKREISSNDIFIEKHVKLDHNKGPDAAFSISYDDLARLVKHVNKV